MKRFDQLEIAQHAMKTNTINETVKVSIWDCCIVSADACPPLGVFGVMPNPQNVHNVHVHGALL